MQHLMLLIVALPLLAAALAHLLAPTLGKGVARLSIAGTSGAFLVSAGGLWFALTADDVYGTAELWDGGFSLLMDPLSALMALVVSGISLLVHVYSVRYMAEEPGYARFFVLLDLMTASLLAMVAAGDLITLLISWHLIGVFLYFLLGQDTRSQPAYRYAFWTLLTYRIGDLPLVLAAVLLFHAYGTWSLADIFAAVAAAPDAHQVLGLPLLEVVAALIALSAFARSAQFLMHTWLPYTMGGPTPVSALMHAGIVNAGGFLINRFAPIFVETSGVLHWVFIVGLVTAVIGSVMMLNQHDIKKALGYSTMGQMGFMIMECGVGAFSLAVFHLIAHGLFKGTMFLGAGGIIHDARKDDGVPKGELYTFVVERRPARTRQPWFIMALITLAFPIFILFMAHYVVAEDFFHKQGAVILLFFGWVTGAQLIFATYHMRTENIWRLFTLILVSFTIVVIGYTVISHAFDVFLYPDEDFRASIYAAAGVDLFFFDTLVILLSAVIIFGWVLTYYSDHARKGANNWTDRLWQRSYALVSAELHLNTLYAATSRALVGAAGRLNVLLRWS